MQMFTLRTSTGSLASTSRHPRSQHSSSSFVMMAHPTTTHSSGRRQYTTVQRRKCSTSSPPRHVLARATYSGGSGINKSQSSPPPPSFKRAEDVLYREENQSRVDPTSPANWWEKLPAVYVLLFGVENRAKTGEPEGIYSIKGCSHAGEGSPFDVVVAWECEEDAERFATLLEAELGAGAVAASPTTASSAQDDVVPEDVGAESLHALGQPTVRAIAPRDLRQFCWQAGHRVCVEPAGSLLLPARANVLQSDWERELALRRGKWSVLPDDATTHHHGERVDVKSASSGDNMDGVQHDVETSRAKLERLWALNEVEGEEEEEEKP
mmetsp:Transcript_9255/g.24926  ORF Transcript_9255/g.24926 Transcript_9255/m.24926 type:complete len:324 (+) Transcript_9255:149-1120(+)